MSPPVKTIEDAGRAAAASPQEPLEESEREQLLEQIAHLQRVAQAGLVTAGLAHDVKNHITVLSGTAFLAERDTDPAEWKEALARI